LNDKVVGRTNLDNMQGVFGLLCAVLKMASYNL
jgi:hypothetical protein